MTDHGWVARQLDKRGPGERLVHAVPCKDGEGFKGWLAVSDQRIWYFQEGPFGGSEEYSFGAAIRRQAVPLSFGRRVMLVIDGSPFTLPAALAGSFEESVRRARASGAGGS